MFFHALPQKEASTFSNQTLGWIMQERERKKSLALSIIAGFLWGTSFPLVKWALSYVSPYMLVSLRFLFASVALLPFSFLYSRETFKKYLKTPSILVVGVLNGLAYFLQFVGQNLTTAIQATLLTNTSSIFATILSYFWLNEQMRYQRVLGVFIAFFGVFLTSTEGRFGTMGTGHFLGNLLCLAGSAFWGVYVVFSKKTSKPRGKSLFFVASMLLYTFFSIALLSIPFLPTFHQVSWSLWLAILYLSLFCTVLPYVLWFGALKNIEASVSAVSLLLMVVVSTILSVLVLSESFTIMLGFGSALICLGIWLAGKG